MLTLSTCTFADSCREIARYDEMLSTIYVVCPDLPKVTDKQAANIIETIFSSRKFVPDEYQIYFVESTDHISEKETKSKSLVGRYYTHDSQLTVWPNYPTMKRIIQIKNN